MTLGDHIRVSRGSLTVASDSHGLNLSQHRHRAQRVPVTGEVDLGVCHGLDRPPHEATRLQC